MRVLDKYRDINSSHTTINHGTKDSVEVSIRFLEDRLCGLKREYFLAPNTKAMTSE
jgi:hypothetical protein